MTTTPEKRTVNEAGHDFPVNSLALVVSHELISKVLEAQQTHQPSEWSRIVLHDDGIEFRPQTMLTLLTYCYATGICSSEDVVYQTANDPILRYLCGKRQPSEALIRHFRRAYRPIIEQSLARVLQSACHSRAQSPQNPWPTDTGLFRQEANRRVLYAIHLDSMAMDV